MRVVAYTQANRNRDIAFVPDVILPEVAFLFVRDVGYHAIPQFLNRFAQTQVALQALTMTAYANAEFDFVDCCIMALAERLEITKICTFDRRDFSIFRPKHCDFLELLPQD